MKHVGKMKNNDAKIVVAYRTLPGDPHSALVIGTGMLGNSYHDALMNLLQDVSGQQTNEFAEILAVRKFPDGSNMLAWLHSQGHLKKVPTSSVLMTPTAQTSISLDELNNLIAQQKGVKLEDLAVKGGEENKEIEPTKEVVSTTDNNVSSEKMTPSQLRAKADLLFKEAQKLRKQADEIDPPKKKTKAVTAEM